MDTLPCTTTELRGDGARRGRATGLAAEDPRIGPPPRAYLVLDDLDGGTDLQRELAWAEG